MLSTKNIDDAIAALRRIAQAVEGLVEVRPASPSLLRPGKLTASVGPVGVVDDLDDLPARAAPTVGGWVLVELLGHRRLYGRLDEVQTATGAWLRLEVAGVDVEAGMPSRTPRFPDTAHEWEAVPAHRIPEWVTFIGAGAVYAITPYPSEEAMLTARYLSGDTRRVAPPGWAPPAPEPCEAPDQDPGDDGNAEIPW